MTARVASRAVILIMSGIATAILIGFVTLQLFEPPSVPSKQAAEKSRQPPVEGLPPSLDCGFNAFMHSTTAIFFYFDVAVSEGETPRFYERAFVSADGARQAYEGGDRPVWVYSLDADSQPTIASPDGATHIVLYGLKLGVPGISEVEAGVRSNVFRNLGGKCRQTNLDGKQR
ncbi:hypothetical protein [Hyphomicrobium sp. LHD-15]|uniref:hypothetical protein n=1 Tax=Hyphomicrobium sp. LHD-15 TaxID=3072142 RepID=UPI00280F9001|nr:hypothetical protein [Hyphomicrobium sp. LHD-15]MDQ8698893.1 hypothetical protein [Hyphomicrobium sp. LHD-15]